MELGKMKNNFFNKKMEKIKVEQQASVFSWFAGWLFTIGFLGLPVGKAVLALVLWPYYIGVAVKALMN
jgi:hypothetical protein